MARFFRSLTLSRLLAVLAVVAAFAMAARAPLDTDMLWHLRAGQWQVEHRMLLDEDVFSYSRSGEPWINHSWLSQIVLYGAYAALGDLGLMLYVAILAAVGMALIYAVCEGSALVRAFAVILAGAAAAVFWSARPQMMSFLMSAAVLALILLHRRGTDRLWLIPLLMVLWANLHGGFAIGFILLVLAAVGEALRWFVERVLGGAEESASDPPTLRPVLQLVVVGLVSAAAISINPYGPRMLLYPFNTVGIGVLRDYIQEWAAPDFHQAQTWPFLWLLLGTLTVAGLSPRRLDWRDAIMVGGTAYSALLAGRNIAVFAVVAAPVLSLHLETWLEAHSLRLNLNRSPRGALVAINWALLGLVLAAAAFKASFALRPESLEASRRDLLPVDAVAYLVDQDLPGPLFNSYNWGGYLIWAAPEYPVYVDGRTDLYNDELLRRYLSIYYAQPGWEERLDEVGANTVLVESSSPLAQVLRLSKDWRCAFSDQLASIYVREP